MNMFYEDEDVFGFGSENGVLGSQNCGDFEGFSGDFVRGSKPISQSLVLDSEKGELVKGCGRIGKKNEAVKTPAALRSHCEAERRRRERINARLATLHGLVPSQEKMDKATLLLAVINHMKQLKKTAAKASEGLLIPTDSDEVRVEPFYEHIAEEGKFHFKASLCCIYRPELLQLLRQTIEDLQVQLVKSEISTLGNRVKNVFYFSCEAKEQGKNDVEALQIVMKSVEKALYTILDKVSLTVVDYSPRTMFPNK